jgi:hypothetical protein
MDDHHGRPIILCGKLEKIGSVVIEGLTPEYEGILPHIPTTGCETALSNALAAVLSST